MDHSLYLVTIQNQPRKHCMFPRYLAHCPTGNVFLREQIQLKIYDRMQAFITHFSRICLVLNSYILLDFRYCSISVIASSLIITKSLLLLNDRDLIAGLDLAGICLIGINVHLQSKAFIHTNLHLIEHRASLIVRLRRHDIAVMNSGCRRVRR